MFLEVEVKLAISDKAIALLPQHPLLQEVIQGPTRHHLISTYFDTPDKQLRRQGFALRVRQQGAEFIQTLKGRNQITSSTGMSARHEWEWPVADMTLNLSLITLPELQALLKQPAFVQQLQAAFVTDFERITWDLQYNQRSHIEIALDRGKITAGAKFDTIQELEMELKSGEVDDLNKVATILERDLELRAGLASKASRGFALLG